MTKVIRNHRVAPRNSGALRMEYGTPAVSEQAIIHHAQSLRVFRLWLNHRTYPAKPPTWVDFKPSGYTDHFVLDQLVPALDLDFYLEKSSEYYRLYQNARAALKRGEYDDKVNPKRKALLIRALSDVIAWLNQAGLQPAAAKPERTYVLGVENAGWDRKVVALCVEKLTTAKAVDPFTGDEIDREMLVTEFWVTLAQEWGHSRETEEDIATLNRKYTGGRGSVPHVYPTKYPASILEPVEACIKVRSMDEAERTMTAWANEIRLDEGDAYQAYERTEIPTDFSNESSAW